MHPDTPLMAKARVAEAALLDRVQALAAQLDPPFTPAARRRITARLADVAVALTALGYIRTLHVQTFPMQHGTPETLFFNRYNRLFPQWHGLVDSLRLWLRAKPVPLYEPATPAPVKALERMLENLHLALSPQTPQLFPGSGQMHGDIPLAMGEYLAHMHAARRLRRAMAGPEPDRFLDVGCGVGLKVLAAAEYFDQADGLELDPALAAAAQDLLARVHNAHGALSAEQTPWAMSHIGRAGAVFCADALQFADYGLYDLIYAYRPIADARLRHALEDRIVAQAKPDCLLIMPYPEFYDRGRALGCHKLKGPIYLPPTTTLDPARLLERAGKTGIFLPDPPPDGYRDEGFVAPLDTTLRRWGQIG